MQLQDTDTVASLLGRVLQYMDKESRTILYSKLIPMLCVSVSYTNRVAVEIGIRRVLPMLLLLYQQFFSF